MVTAGLGLAHAPARGGSRLSRARPATIRSHPRWIRAECRCDRGGAQRDRTPDDRACGLSARTRGSADLVRRLRRAAEGSRAIGRTATRTAAVRLVQLVRPRAQSETVIGVHSGNISPEPPKSFGKSLNF